MEDYKILSYIGRGSFADVYKAREKSTGELVAIKKLKRKYEKLEDCLELEEYKSLKILHKESCPNKLGEDNIIKLKKIIFVEKIGIVHFVFEYMETDLYELMKSIEPKKLSEIEICNIIYQTLLGLSFMHRNGYFHRDMKPENILLFGNKIKIADFGLARKIRSMPPYTDYVSTRIYRAPECILKSTNYNSPIDIWGVGCIMAEMYMYPYPLFPGNNEIDVLYKICTVLGTPTYSTWKEGVELASSIGIKFPNKHGTDLEKIIPNASREAIDLMKQMIKWNPKKRSTASSLLKHSFFEKNKIYYYSLKINTKSTFLNNNNSCLEYNNSNKRNKLENNKEYIINNKFKHVYNKSNNIIERKKNF